MTLFELTPITTEQLRSGKQCGITYKDKKGRAYRRRPYWIDLGKGPEGKTCKTCQYLVRTEYSKVYFKCGTWKITAGPGTQIATTDPCCIRYQRKGLPMFTVKRVDE
jgi:hypothetical protein